MAETAPVDAAQCLGPTTEGALLKKQQWFCPACGASLANAGAVLTVGHYAGMMFAVMVHDVCRSELPRVGGRFLALAEQVAKVEPTERARDALRGAPWRTDGRGHGELPLQARYP